MPRRYGGGGGGGSYDYVQPGAPADPVEGETWYDTDADEAQVYDGAVWHLQTVTDHGELGNIQSDQHHSPPTSTQQQTPANSIWVHRGNYSPPNWWDDNTSSGKQWQSLNDGEVVYVTTPYTLHSVDAVAVYATGNSYSDPARFGLVQPDGSEQWLGDSTPGSWAEFDVAGVDVDGWKLECVSTGAGDNDITLNEVRPRLPVAGPHSHPI